MQIEILSAQIGRKWVAFRDGADLSEFEDGKLQRWTLESRDCTTGTLIATGEKVIVPATSPSFSLSYSLAFAEVHLEKVSGPMTGEKPSREFLETIPTAILTAYVNRADPTRPITDNEYNTLKKPKPSGSTDSASS